jgi:hypothetical protein
VPPLGVTVKVCELPAQITALDGVTEQLGVGLIVTVAEPVIVAAQPVVALSATMVYVPAAVWLLNVSALPVPATGEPAGLSFNSN